MFILVPDSDNTDAVTLDIDGDTRDLKSRDGTDLGAGYIKAGEAVMLMPDGDDWRLLLDHRFSALAGQVEQAKDYAEAAQAAAEAAVANLPNAPTAGVERFLRTNDQADAGIIIQPRSIAAPCPSRLLPNRRRRSAIRPSPIAPSRTATTIRRRQARASVPISRTTSYLGASRLAIRSNLVAGPQDTAAFRKLRRPMSRQPEASCAPPAIPKPVMARGAIQTCCE